MPVATLFRYLALRTVVAVLGLFAVLSFIVVLADLVESLRFTGKFGGDFFWALRVTLLRTPSIVQLMLPFVFLFGAIWLFNDLNKRAEIAVMRSAGLSVWRLVGPAAFVAIFSGLLVITVVDPASTRALAYSEALKDQLSGRSSSIVRLFGDGIWLRQRERGHILLINAREFDESRDRLNRVVIWRLDGESRFLERIDAPEAVLTGRMIELHDARARAAGDQRARSTPVYAVPTALTPADLRERIEKPEAIPLWDLPRFVALAEAAGLPTTPYTIRFHDLCSTPFKLVAMVLIAAMFSLRPTRSGGAFRLFLLAVGAGFVLYVLSEVSTAFGVSGLAPVALATWTPAVVALLAAVTGLLHFEEG